MKTWIRAFLPVFVVAFALAVMASAVAPQPAHAVQPDEILQDSVLEKRARSISKNLRCLVCQNQSIDDSNAELARDLRILVRERLLAGDSDSQVLEFAVARYGDYVLLKPPFKAATYGLWFGPLMILLAGGLAVFFFLRRHRRGVVVEQPSVGGLSAEEEQKFKTLMTRTGASDDDRPATTDGDKA